MRIAAPTFATPGEERATRCLDAYSSTLRRSMAAWRSSWVGRA